MPIISGGGGGGVTSPITTPAPLVFSPANKDAVAIQLKPVSGATVDQTDQLEVYDDAGHLLHYVDAKGGFETTTPTASSLINLNVGQERLLLRGGAAGTDQASIQLKTAADIEVQVPAFFRFVVEDSGGSSMFAITEDTRAIFAGGVMTAALAASAANVPRLSQLSPRFTITSGALPTATLSSGTGAQISTTRDAETVTPFTGDGTNNAATLAVALSPDDVTYSTLDTLSIAAAVNLTGVLALSATVRVPAGWYLKLTAVHGTIGTTTYY